MAYIFKKAADNMVRLMLQRPFWILCNGNETEMRPSGAEKDWEIMKKSGMSETMQTLMRKSVCVMLSLLLLLPAVFPVKAAAETAPAKVVRVGSFEDTFNYVNEKGARKGGST